MTYPPDAGTATRLPPPGKKPSSPATAAKASRPQHTNQIRLTSATNACSGPAKNPARPHTAPPDELRSSSALTPCAAADTQTRPNQTRLRPRPLDRPLTGAGTLTFIDAPA